MILGSVEGLNGLHTRLRSFLASEQRAIRVPADVSGSPEPYEELLPALEIEKTEGPIYASLSSDRALKISGGAEHLAVYVEFFRFRDDEDGSHHHPEHVKRPGYLKPGTLSVIIEADSKYIEGLQGER